MRKDLTLSMRVTPTTKDAIEELAEERGQSYTTIVERAILDARKGMDPHVWDPNIVAAVELLMMSDGTVSNEAATAIGLIGAHVLGITRVLAILDSKQARAAEDA